MKMQEYQAKALLAQFGVPTPKGIVCTTSDEVKAAAESLGGGAVVKAQVLAGGRGKAGAVKVAKTAEACAEFAGSILGKKLYFEQAKEELTITTLLVEELLPIAKEYYLGVVVDRDSQRNVFILSSQGGMDIEEVAHSHPDAIGRYAIDPAIGIKDFHIRELARKGGIPDSELGKLAPFIKNLYAACVKSDATLAEINPLVVLADGNFIAGDAKIDIDDNTLYRHPELAAHGEGSDELNHFEKEARRRGINNYVHLGGNVGIICNGAGLVMGTMDEVKRAGGEPANFLDIGGGAKAELVRSSLELILLDKDVKAILINIFGGITRGDEVAKGIIEATSTMDIKVPLVVRLAGTNSEEGLALLKDANLVPAATMQEAAQKVVALL
ncbi:ADP-forming succinate--CoA ligase subunit beta [Armatimonas sp.]|uniref:ADP-forming succinate--CoA ligase subunit beta n=1 Tax=Armatimonas sp. TaxID=1872638 RepID=UPI00286B671C|nr:ADP-forming succinate--CoA ligase subunit beta [Armatimonas sp.]